MNLFETVLIISCLVYSAFLWWCFTGWSRIPEITSAVNGAATWFTVIVPARNEEENIQACLESLLRQEYSPDQYEVIVVDDDSTDGTVRQVDDFISRHPGFHGRIVSVKSTQDPSAPYKKRAIEAAVRLARGSWILTTDADCILPPLWLQTIASFREQHHPVFLSAPVVLSGESSLLEKFQSLEFMGLVGMGAASIARERPMMCNGANLGYDKELFVNAGGYGAAATASGDDTQLLRSFSRQHAGPILFLKSRDACVATTGKKSVGDLMQQRLRWSSKIPMHMSVATVLMATNAFVLHAGLVAGMFIPSPLWLAAWLIKSVAEFIFLASLTGFFRKRPLLWYFPLAQLVYPFYITVTGLLALRGTYRWKGRKQTVHA